MTATTHLLRAAWDELSTPAELAADCRAAEAHLPTPGPREPMSHGTPKHRFEELSALAAGVVYELD